MHIYKLFFAMISMLFLIFATFVWASDDPPDNGKLRGKDPIYDDSRQNNLPWDLGDASGNSNCIKKCIKQNQMASVGFEVIQEQCRQACNLDDILDQVRSQDVPEYMKGVKALCETDDPRAVQPLITALKRDINVRAGLWATIIPALGRLGDSAAVPILEHSLTLDDDQRVIPVLISALQPEEDPETTQVAMRALHRFGSEAVPKLIDAFDDFSPEYSATQERLRLCHLLGKTRDKRAIERLHESLKDPDAIIEKCASEYVGNK